MAAAADLSKIRLLESIVLASGDEVLPNLRADIDAITAAAAGLGDCRLIVIDPVSAYLNGVDDNRNSVLRGVLHPIKLLAERIGTAVVLVNHLTKRNSPTASIGSWARSHTQAPAGQITSSSPTPTTVPAGGFSCWIMAATPVRRQRPWHL